MKNALLAALAVATAALPAVGAAFAYSDDAGQTEYDTDFVDGDDGNTGSSSFSPWSITFTGTASAHTFSPSPPAGEIDTAGRSWRMTTGPGAGTAQAVRTFPPGQPNGTKFSLQAIHPSIVAQGRVSLGEDGSTSASTLRGASGGN